MGGDRCFEILEAGGLGLLSFRIDQLHRLGAKLAVGIQGVDDLAVGFSTQPFLGEGFVNGRASGPVGVGPLLADEAAVPTQDRAWGDQAMPWIPWPT